MLIETSRRRFLSGLFATPAIIAYDKLMPVKRLEDLTSLDRYLLRYKVVSKKSGLILSLSFDEIRERQDDLLPYLEPATEYTGWNRPTRESLGIDPNRIVFAHGGDFGNHRL